jgi:hypothetical protein
MECANSDHRAGPGRPIAGPGRPAAARVARRISQRPYAPPERAGAGPDRGRAGPGPGWAGPVSSQAASSSLQPRRPLLGAIRRRGKRPDAVTGHAGALIESDRRRPEATVVRRAGTRRRAPKPHGVGPCAIGPGPGPRAMLPARGPASAALSPTRRCRGRGGPFFRLISFFRKNGPRWPVFPVFSEKKTESLGRRGRAATEWHAGGRRFPSHHDTLLRVITVAGPGPLARSGTTGTGPGPGGPHGAAPCCSA